MTKYRVEIGYKTKRGGVQVGMTVDAFSPDEADDFARAYVLNGRPARKWVYSNVTEATDADIKSGIYYAPGRQP